MLGSKIISFHINNGYDNFNGFEIYAPCKSNLNFAGEMADKIKKSSSILFSNNTSFKKRDGVYVRNFTNNVIKDFESTAKKKGYEPYNITFFTLSPKIFLTSCIKIFIVFFILLGIEITSFPKL